MKSIENLIEELHKTQGDAITSKASELFLQKVPWNELAHDYIVKMPDSVFYERVLKMNIPFVEPRVHMIYEEPGKFQIIVHHFNIERFQKYMLEKRIGPHLHHFPFATRILRGSYWNILFSNTGTDKKPKLEPETQGHCVRGTVYTLPYEKYHMVIRPEADTMSLMVRGPAVFNPNHLPEPGYGRKEILESKKTILKMLAEPYPLKEGELLSYDPINLYTMF